MEKIWLSTIIKRKRNPKNLQKDWYPTFNNQENENKPKQILIAEEEKLCNLKMDRYTAFNNQWNTLAKNQDIYD